MTVSRTIPPKWSYTDGDGDITKDDIVKRANGWVKIHKNGQEELIHAMVDIGNAAATIASVTNYADGTYSYNDTLSFTVVFSEAVDVDETDGTPSVQVYTAAGDVYDLPYASGTGSTDLVFSGDTVGVADGDLVVNLEVALNGGTILDSDSNWSDNDFPNDYTQPTIAMVTPVISSATNYADGTYADTETLEFTVIFDKAVDVVTTGGIPSLQVYTVQGSEVDLSYASGTGTTNLVFSGAPTGIVDGTLVVVESLVLNLGEINDATEATSAGLAFASDYVQPTITMTTP